MNKFGIIGGDLRSVKLAELLCKDGNRVFTYGLENAQEIVHNKEIFKNGSVKEIIDNSDIIVAPIPFSKDGVNLIATFSDNIINIEDLLLENIKYKKYFFAGSISEENYKRLSNHYEYVYDLMNSEPLAVLNTIATAEGAIDVIIQNTETIIHGRNILILGFGRVAKTLAYKLRALGSFVTCAARNDSDIAWIKAYGYNSLNINLIENKFEEFDIIINTVPHVIIREKELKTIKKDTFLVDLASKPGGFDFSVADELNIKYIKALALPGKVAPKTSALFIKEAIYNSIFVN